MRPSADLSKAVEDIDYSNIGMEIDVSIDAQIFKCVVIEKPFFDYCIKSRSIIKPFRKDNTVTMMTIDNLPSELPRDSSKYFGKILMRYLIPFLREKDLSLIHI